MSNSRYRVAVIDDEPTLIGMLALMMRIDGRLEVSASFPTADQALEALGGANVDAVVCDLNMPGTTGLEAMPQLREKCQGAVIAMYTATPEDASAAVDLGADAVVDKVAEPQELLDRLVTLIAAKRGGETWT